MIRLHIPQPLSAGAALAPTLDQSRYLTQVMRLKIGDSLLVFNGLFPLIREDVQRWLLALDRLQRLEPRHVIPGHGPVGDARTLGWQRRLIEDVFESVKNRYSAGVPVEDAANEPAPERFAALPQAANRWPGAVKGIYRVLDDHT